MAKSLMVNLKYFTCNQLMTLFDIKRGTLTQICIGSYKNDLANLLDCGLIEKDLIASIKKKENRYQLTKKGFELCSNLEYLAMALNKSSDELGQIFKQ